MNKMFGAFAATAVATLIATGAHAEEAKKKEETKPYCQNNACKGHSACAGHGNASCAGKNNCKGVGFLNAKNKKDCEKDGKGKWMAKG